MCLTFDLDYSELKFSIRIILVKLNGRIEMPCISGSVKKNDSDSNESYSVMDDVKNSIIDDVRNISFA